MEGWTTVQLDLLSWPTLALNPALNPIIAFILELLRFKESSEGKPPNCFHFESSKFQGKWGSFDLILVDIINPITAVILKALRSKEKPHNCFHSKSSKVQGSGGIFDLWLVECWQMIDRAGKIRGLRGQLSPATDLDGYWSKIFSFKRLSITKGQLISKILKFSFEPKIEQKCFCIFALK